MESSLSPNIKNFEQNYQTHLKRLKLNGMQPKTIEAYSLAVRRAGGYFGYQIDALQHGLAARRRAAAASRRYRRGAPTRAHPRCQGQPGPFRAVARRHLAGAAPLLASAPQPRPVIPQPNGRPEKSAVRDHAA